MSAVLPLLSAGIGNQSRSTACIVTKVARAFHILRIDGYSWSKTIPSGESICSSFTVGDLTGWDLHYYPNGTDASNHYSNSISVYLRFNGGGLEHDVAPRHVVAQYKFSLLDLTTGAAVYELPTETGIYYTSGHGEEDEDYYHYLNGNVYYYDDETMEEHVIPPPVELGCGYVDFIAKAELERWRETLLRDDSLAICCDTTYIRSWTN